MVITESDIKSIVSRCAVKLNEYHQGQQLMLPFDGSSDPYNYMQFIEWLESIGKYGQLPPASDSTIEQLYRDKKFLNMCGKCRCYMYGGGEIDWDVFAEDVYSFVSQYGEKVLNGHSVEDIFDNMTNNRNVIPVEDFPTYLTDEGKQLWDEYLTDIGSDEFYYWANTKLIQDKRGLLYCERAIDVPQMLSRYEHQRYNGETIDFFDYLAHNIGDSVGVYWSYAKNGGRVYSGNFGSGDELLLKGWVDPAHVDWATTFSLDSMGEQELRLDAGALVELTDVIFDAKERKRLPLKGSLIVRA